MGQFNSLPDCYTIEIEMPVIWTTVLGGDSFFLGNISGEIDISPEGTIKLLARNTLFTGGDAQELNGHHENKGDSRDYIKLNTE